MRKEQNPKTLECGDSVGEMKGALGPPFFCHIWQHKSYHDSVCFFRSSRPLFPLIFIDLQNEPTSRLFEKGFDTMEVRTITGHKTLQMLARYTHLRAEDLVERMDE